MGEYSKKPLNHICATLLPHKIAILYCKGEEVKKVIYLFLMVVSLDCFAISETVDYIPKLQKGEERFANNKRMYGWNDFHPAWKIRYFDVVRFSTVPLINDDSLELPKPPIHFEMIYQVGRLPEGGFHQKDTEYLARAVTTSGYFWKYQVMLLLSYTIYSLRFIDADDGRLKAIETLDEVRQFLGRIDTPAELSLWLLASEPPYRKPYSYIRKNKLFRVRFWDDDIFTCTYHEYFKYYDEEGKVVKFEEIKKIRYEEPCPEIAI